MYYYNLKDISIYILILINIYSSFNKITNNGVDEIANSIEKMTKLEELYLYLE